MLAKKEKRMEGRGSEMNLDPFQYLEMGYRYIWDIYESNRSLKGNPKRMLV